MNILWITWKDRNHPEAGGAEVVCYELCKRLTKEGHTVTLLTSDYEGAAPTYGIPGVSVIRAGSNRYTHPFQALWYYIRHLKNKFDLIIEEVNGGAPYFASWFGRATPRFMLYHQLGKINWLYEVPLPFGYAGYYVLVPIATRIASLSGAPLITVSESSRQELEKFGFHAKSSRIISEGIQISPAKDMDDLEKFAEPTVLSHGSMRAMKRTIDQVKAFELAKKHIPNLKMKISGSAKSTYGKKVMKYIAQSLYKNDITYLGRITDEQKRELMQKCHVILVTSIEEGWGLIVTEANSQGTPAVVYDVAGLRDSVKHNETGIVTAESPADLAGGIVDMLSDDLVYNIMRKKGWKWSKHITFDQSYSDFKDAVGLV